LFMEHYAPCDHNIGLHFEPVDEFIETPVIREEIRNGENRDEGYGIVYLPFYSDEIIYNALKNIQGIPWIVFSKHSKKAYQNGPIKFEPINGKLFTEKLLGTHLVITAAGFGTTTEALHLGKKMIVIPMKGQYEQLFNAFTLKNSGVTVLKSLLSTHAESLIKEVLTKGPSVSKNYPDNAKIISEKLIELYNGPISESIAFKNDTRIQPLDYYFNSLNLKRDPSGTLSF